MRNLLFLIIIFLLTQNVSSASKDFEIFEQPPAKPLISYLLKSDSLEEKKRPHQKSISFSGGSYFSVTYCLGVFDVLQKYFDLSNVIYLGDSSGSLVATGAALNMPVDHSIKEFLLPSLQDKKSMPHCGFSQWSEVITKNVLSTIRKFNPQLVGQAHKIVSGKLYVSVTHVKFPFLRNELVSTFHSDEDLVDTLMASCHLPWVINGNFFTKWRGNTCIDGGLTNHNPVLDKNTMRINPFLWRSPFFWIKHGCFTLHTEEEAFQAIRWGYEDASKNLQYFLDHGFTLKSPSIPLPLSVPSACVEHEQSLSIPYLLNKKLYTFWFYSKNIFLSQANSYFSLLKSILYKEQYSEYIPLFAKIFTVYMFIKHRNQIKKNLLGLFLKRYQLCNLRTI
ncbi:MAG: hypothetical protein NT128_05215 [Proteobacteria bacterium]|nr:hypothetical protein [Pseudomonadota bacterium]